MEHTKGEWRAEFLPQAERWDRDNRPQIGMFSINCDQNQIGVIFKGGDARLIASAPDCHRELSGIVDAFERLGWTSFMAEMTRRIPQAKQALAKAEVNNEKA